MFETYYMQVLSLGFLWTLFHCSGMCGPLVAGLTSRPSDPVERWPRLLARAKRVLSYQSGRAVTYAILGGLAGVVGAYVHDSVRSIAALSGFVIAPIIALVGIATLTGRSMNSEAGAKVGAQIGIALRALRRSRIAQTAWIGSFVTGMVLGLLPCVLMFWTLGIAATTSSPIHGAGVMVTLVVMTTPTLLAAGSVASIWRIQRSDGAVGAVLLASAAWMLLVALAANDIIGHAEFTFRLLNEPYMVMFF